MQWTSLNEIREQYLNFFQSKDHLKAESFSLVPQGDKSLLLINAGMAPLKKYFTGELTPPKNRMTTCQKCIRTPDIERVGITARHGTYFEMLGNFSFGDYFKKEAIEWAWEFCTKTMQMPIDKIWVTVYLEDDEAYDMWTKHIGVAENRMKRLGKEDNFWEHGAGPCGPCSELHFDRGEKYGCGSPDCAPGCDCDRYTEFWNLVFTQFESDGKGKYDHLKNCNIDTGMGLERLACIMQGVDNLFEVDTVQKIMKHVIDIAKVNYHDDEKNDISLRVITDHIRSTTFMISDGVIPSNEGRGYVLRRLLRRAARHGKLLGVNETFLYKVCETVIEENKNAYPNLLEKKDLIIKIIKSEEESFAKTVDNGLRLLSEVIENLDGKILSGADAFKLQDTFGFPIDLTKEILAEKGLSVDEEEFARIVKENRERTRNARKDAGADAWKNKGTATKGLDSTDFLGYSELSAHAKILAVVADDERKDFVTAEQKATIILDKTPFYALSGGQVGDSGVIETDKAVFKVDSTTKTADGIYLHSGSLVSGDILSVGDEVSAKVDDEKHQNIKKNHTAAHLLQAALREVLGSHVEQAGQLVDEKTTRFDFVHFSAMTAEEIAMVETRVNEIILGALSVQSEEMPIDKAREMGAMALFGEKYGDVVRVVKIGDFSVELCGGTHVANAGEIGLFKIVSESSVAAGVRRIEAVTGKNFLNFVNQKLGVINSVADALKISNVNDVVVKTKAVVDTLKLKEKELEKKSTELANIKISSLLNSAVEIDGLMLVTTMLEDTTVDEIRQMMSMIRDKGENYIGVIGGVQKEKCSGNIGVCCGKEAIAKGAKAGLIAKGVAQLAGGSGGGKPDSAMAGAKDVAKIPAALEQAAEIIKTMIG
ncbi:MAG: alanine--tRNA ligase [Clostridia bacterium]